jgi:hypothetical protein
MFKAVVIAALIIGIGAFAAGHGHGYRSASAKCQTEALREELFNATANLERERAARVLERRQAETIANQAAQRQERIDELRVELETRPPPAVCRSTRSDVERLRNIRPAPRDPPTPP